MLLFDRRVNSLEYGGKKCSKCDYHFFDLRITADGTSSLKCRACNTVFGGIGNADTDLVQRLLEII